MAELATTNSGAFIYTRFISRLNAAGVIWIFAIMFLICADIAGRNLFDHPITGVPEMVSLSLVAAVFLQLANAIHHNRLTSTEFFRNRYSLRSPDFLHAWQLLMALCAAVLMFFMALGAWPDFTRALASNEFAGVESVFTITVWPVKFIIVLGAAISALEYCRQFYRGLKTQGALQLSPFLKALLLPLAGFFVLIALWQFDAEPRVVGVCMIALALLLITMGLPIAISLLLTGFLGLAVLKQDFTIATRTLSLAAEGTISEYVFATVPLFVLMGLFVNVADIGRDAFRAAQQSFGWVKGGLGVATVAANAIFAAITGISIASAAIFSKIAVPELVRHGYTKRFAVGLTAGSSVLGMLIPPSLLLIIYGVIAEVSIGDLFVAAIIPGIILACCFAVGVMLMAFFAPGFVGEIAGEQRGEKGNEQSSWPGLVAVLVLVLVVLGGIYGGIFTPTEAGAAGALAAMLIALARGKLKKGKLWEVMQEAGEVSVSILFLIICASIFSMMLTLTELPQVIAAILGDSSLGLAGFLVIYLVLLIILGTVLDSTSIMLILLPLALPVVAAMGEDLVWFGIITVIGIEIGLLTPPLGLSVYVIKASVDDESISLGMIFSGALPFVFITLLVTIVLMVFPELSLFLIN